MKKVFVLILAVLVLFSAAACGKTAAEEKPAETAPLSEGTGATEPENAGNASAPLLGGWQKPDSPEVTDQIAAVFAKGMEGLVGANYTPVAYIGRQIVSGTNHALLCREKMVVPNAVETFAIVYLYEKLDGSVEITDIVDSGVETWISDLSGGWSQADSPVITDQLAALLDKAFESMLGADYSPLALLSTQVVAGRNYCVLCEQTVVYPDAQPEYVFVYLYEDLDGNAQITDVAHFAADAAES